VFLWIRIATITGGMLLPCGVILIIVACLRLGRLESSGVHK